MLRVKSLWPLAFSVATISLALYPLPSLAFELHAGGGLILSKPIDNQNTTYDSKTGIVFGGGLGMQLIPMSPIGIELNGIMATRTFAIGTTTIASKAIIGSALLGLHLGNFLSLLAGPYYSMAQGSLTTSTSGASATIDYGTAHLKKNDAGLVGVARIYFFALSPLHLFVDGRYYYGMLNAATEGTFKYGDIVTMTGLRLKL